MLHPTHSRLHKNTAKPSIARSGPFCFQTNHSLLRSCSHCVSHCVKNTNSTVQYSWLLLQVSWMDRLQFRMWNPALPTTLKWSSLSLTQSITLPCAHSRPHAKYSRIAECREPSPHWQTCTHTHTHISEKTLSDLHSQFLLCELQGRGNV